MGGTTWYSFINDTGAGVYLIDATEVNANLAWTQQHILPHNAGVKTNNTYDLGMTAYGFRDIYLTNAIRDDAGNELVKFTKTASAVNEITITNAATGNNPSIDVSGEDVSLLIEGSYHKDGSITTTTLTAQGDKTFGIPMSCFLGGTVAWGGTLTNRSANAGVGAHDVRWCIPLASGKRIVKVGIQVICDTTISGKNLDINAADYNDASYSSVYNSTTLNNNALTEWSPDYTIPAGKWLILQLRVTRDAGGTYMYIYNPYVIYDGETD